MLMRRTPLAKARANPRRDEGRVQHGRVKAKGRFPTTHHKRYWDSLDRQCAVCGRMDATVIHHILAPMVEKMRPRDHRFVAVLCPQHHNMGNISVHLLGSEEAFRDVTGIDLVEVARANWSKFDG